MLPMKKKNIFKPTKKKKKNISIKKKHTYTNTLDKNKFHFLGTTINTNG